MKFEWRNGLIYAEIEITYGNKLFKISDCIIDTGSASTAIDIEQVDFDYHKPTLIRRLIGIGGGIQEVLTQRVDNLIIDGQSVNGIDIEFGDIRCDLGITGFIGTNVLSRFNVALDFQRQTLDLS